MNELVPKPRAQSDVFQVVSTVLYNGKCFWLLGISALAVLKKLKIIFTSFKKI
jgi:hypothetical protein